jgi:predicted lipoprotein with Yx(FWY)xxD motif
MTQPWGNQCDYCKHDSTDYRCTYCAQNPTDPICSSKCRLDDPGYSGCCSANPGDINCLIYGPTLTGGTPPPNLPTVPGTTPTGTPPPPPPAAPGAPPAGGAAATGVIVKTTQGPQGVHLTDGQGKSLYLFMADTSSQSTCNGACAAVWPPLIVPSGQSATAQGEAQQSLLGTTTRSDGSTQVTYNGRPVYYYAPDQSPGETKGQGINSFGALWYLDSPSGTPVMGSSSGGGTTPSGGGSSSGTGSGGGYLSGLLHD